MANYQGTSRTNYFRVTDEAKYQELYNNLCANDTIDDLTKEKDGTIYHGFGSYSGIDYKINEDGSEMNFDKFLEELQKILPDDEAFVYFEAGHEKLKYITGYCIVVTNKTITNESITDWAERTCKSLLGDNYNTEFNY